MRWHTLRVLITGKYRQEEQKFKTIPGYTERPSLGYMRPWDREAEGEWLVQPPSDMLSCRLPGVSLETSFEVVVVV